MTTSDATDHRRDAHLTGLAVIVTGAGQGIGRACAVELGRLGAHVIVNDIDGERALTTAEEIIRAGGTALAHPADISVPDQATALVQRSLTEFGCLDGLVNNAALMANGTIEEYDATLFRRLLEVNVLGLANCGTAALAHMLAAGRGAVVNITSGSHLGMEHMGLYGATKGAVASLTYTWALEANGRGVRVNAVSPWAGGGMSSQTDAYRAARGLPVNSANFPEPSSNAPAIAFLLSPLASHVNGQLVRIQGTQLSLMTHPAVTTPVLEHGAEWTVTDVCRAFTEHLDDRLAPVGIAYGEPATTTSPEPLFF